MATNIQNSELTEVDVFDLVIDFLNTKGLVETTQVLKKEVQRNESFKASKNTGTRLEDLLEKSYVTELASGLFLPRKKIRSHLDAALIPQSNINSQIVVDDAPKKLAVETQIIAYNPCGNDPYGASVMPIYQTATFAQVFIFLYYNRNILALILLFSHLPLNLGNMIIQDLVTLHVMHYNAN